MREDNMTSSKDRNIGGEILKSNKCFICILFAILFELETMHY